MHIKIDREIIHAQSDEYRQKMYEFIARPTLSGFGRIPEPRRVSWQRDPQLKKYFIDSNRHHVFD